MDNKSKKDIIMYNNYVCKYGFLINKTDYKTYRNMYMDEYNCGRPNTFCDVYVFKLHPLIIAKEYTKNNTKPTLVNIISEKFKDENIDNVNEVYDEKLNLRSNFITITKHNNDLIRENESLYTPNVIIMRDENLNIINEYFTVSFITLLGIDNYDYVYTKNKKKLFNTNTYIKIKQLIELIFQTAHVSGSRVIIFGDIGCSKYKLPCDQIIDIINFCILKYGHLYKNICFCHDVKTPEENIIYNMFLENIIKPQNLASDIDEQDELLLNIISLQNN